jgi:uncharacterized protein (TIGR03435 family)
MLQALLIRRFRLRFHYEAIDSDVYLLQNTSKLPVARPTSADAPKTQLSSQASVFRDHGHWVLQDATMPDLARELSNALGTPVIDNTGLKGAYDYKQRGSDVPPADGQGAESSLLMFLGELKLRLHKVKRPVDVFVIDRAGRPTPE